MSIRFPPRWTLAHWTLTHWTLTHWTLTLSLISLVLLSPGALAKAQCQQPILVLGDSLSAGYGINEEDGWVALLRQRLQQLERPQAVVNASISGETSAGGVSRLPRLLDEYQPAVVVLELGGNDGLRGYPIQSLRQQLQKAIELSRQANADVLLLGMQIPPNYGPRYSRLFSEVYPKLADSNNVEVVPFFLDGVATDKNLMQQDGIHPTAEAQPRMLDNIWPALQSMLATDCS